MTREEITTRIIKIAEETTGAELTADGDLKADGLDSLFLVAVIVGMEAHFAVAFEDDDLQPDKLVTLQDLVELAEKYL